VGMPVWSMRGILFALAGLVALVAILVSVNPALAGAGLLGPAPWALWGVALLLVQWAPERGPTKQEVVEASFLLAAREEEAEIEALWPAWEGFVLPSLSTDEPEVRLVSEGVELCDELLRERSSRIASFSPRQRLAITQQRVIKAELSRKDLTNAEIFDLGVALLQARKGLLAG
jgi:hypothetical protein